MHSKQSVCKVLPDLSYLVARKVLQHSRWANKGTASLGKQFHALLADDALTTISFLCEDLKDGKKRACTHAHTANVRQHAACVALSPGNANEPVRRAAGSWCASDQSIAHTIDTQPSSELISSPRSDGPRLDSHPDTQA